MAFSSSLRLLKVDFEVSENRLDRYHMVIFSAQTPLGSVEVTLPIGINTVADEEIVSVTIRQR